MIHPMILVFALIVVLAICFALIYLSIHLYTRSEDKRLALERDQYITAVEVATGEDYSIRHQHNEEDQSHSVYLSITGPKSHGIEPATMGSPASVRIETNAEVMDEMAIAWIRYRGLGGAVGGPVGKELGSPENPWT